jgi:tetratricopeptide (TPR) repeat protein
VLPKLTHPAIWPRLTTLLVATLLGAVTHATDASAAPRSSRRVGIDTRFGELVQEAGKQYHSKNYGRAVSLYTAALQMGPDPKNAAMLYAGRATANQFGQNHPAAIADFDKLIRLQPTDSSAHNMAAWLRATSRDPAARNGKLAVQQATRACEG